MHGVKTRSGADAAQDAPPLVGLIRNPRSHRNKGRPPEMDGAPNVLTEAPRNHADLREVLAGFAAKGIAYLAIDGGDGTVRDVLTCGADIWGDDWPELIVLPKGKTNALTVDLGLPNRWTLAEALAAAPAGRRVERRPLVIARADGTPIGDDSRLIGYFFGAGVFTLTIDKGQEAHRMGAFNSFAVGLTIALSLGQILFGRKGNRWRQPVPMDLRDAATGQPLPQDPRSQAGQRFFMIATTFERYPLGVKPFGDAVPPGIKVGLIDRPLRRVIGSLPAVLFGFYPRVISGNGGHRLGVDALDMDLGGSFILDGEAYPGGAYRMAQGPLLRFVTP